MCAGAVLVTGLVGAMFTQRLMTAFGFADLPTRGLATASSCHGFGAATPPRRSRRRAVRRARLRLANGFVVPRAARPERADRLAGKEPKAAWRVA